MVKRIDPVELAECQMHWLAPSGSAQERRMLARLSQNKPTPPNNIEERNAMWWKLAKQKFLGKFVYETAMDRHKSLTEEVHWYVAYLLSAGYTQKEIKDDFGIGSGTVGRAIQALKSKVQQTYDIEKKANPAQIVRWFLGV